MRSLQIPQKTESTIMQSAHLTRTISLIGAFLVSAATAQAVDPPPDGGYPGANTAEGDDALFNLTTGVSNTATGYHALFSNTTGNDNTATGTAALGNNSVGINNTATGYGTLLSNTTGSYNTATGVGALSFNGSGIANTATGVGALGGGFANTGSNNTASGFDALFSNTTGDNNTASGVESLLNNTSGSNNIALGNSAGSHLTAGSNNIDIGNMGGANESNTIRIGTAGTQTASFIAGVRGVPITGGMAIGVDANGQLGVRGSSARFKEAIEPMDKASETIYSLRPVTFRYKKAFDPSAQPQFGLVAEQVAKVDPDLVVSDKKGKPFSVRYEEVNAMLLNEFLKEHRQVTDQSDQIAELKATVKELRSALRAQAVQLQKVSNQLRTQAPAPRVVANGCSAVSLIGRVKQVLIAAPCRIGAGFLQKPLE
jgi:Chaperone of endosialidase